MNFPKNTVFLTNNNDRIDIVIKMVHPKWITNLLMTILIACVGLLFYGFLVFNIFEAIGPTALILLSFYAFLMYLFARVVFSHKYGEELIILSELSLSFIRNYGLYKTKINTIRSPNYDIGFIETNTEVKENPLGNLIFFDVDTVTKLETVLFESALEISYDEFTIIKSYFLRLKNSEDYLFKNDIVLN